MCSSMSNKIPLIWKELLAYLTFITLCASVGTTVPYLVSVLYEILIAGIALMRLLP